MPSANTDAATGATVPPHSRHLLRRRVVSALVLAPLALVEALAGSPSWDIFVALFGAVMAWEWTRVCGQGRFSPAGFAVVAAVLVAVAAAAVGAYAEGLLILAVGGMVAALVARLIGEPAAQWQGAGAFYVGLPCVAILWIRADPAAGLQTLIWILALVWAVDTGAYAAGRSLGGPRLAPHVSPGKTWAGLVGGVVAGALVGLGAAVWLALPSATLIPAVSAALAIVEQAGDLFESAVKRRFGVKDSSSIIPGHGGILDRVDGLLAVVVAVAALSVAGGGSPLTWR